MKKVISILLAALMVFSLTVTAFAEKEAPTTEHTYKAYQIFSGTQSEDGAELGNIEWGDGVNGTALLTALKGSNAFGDPNAFKDCETASDVAEAMKDWKDGSDEAKAFAKLANDYIVDGKGQTVVSGQDDLDAGYYLVVDETETVGTDDAYNLSLLQLTQKGKFEINKKASVPEVEKTLSDDNKGLKCTEEHEHTKECYNWADSNEVAIGDTVHFKVESAVPETAADYDYYYFIVGDTMGKGLTYTDGSLKVYIGGELAEEGEDYTYNGLIYDAQTGLLSFRVALIDAKSHAGESVVVTYDAVLNENAVIGSTGNLNEAVVDYSNNPNEDYDGTKDDHNPGFPKDEEKTPLGETPKDKTLTYTTQIKIFKVDGDGNPLEGAEFTLTGTGLNTVLVSKDVFEENNNGDYYKLTDGTYTKEEPVTEDYMKAAEDGATEGYVVDNDYTGDDKVVIDGTTYRPYKPAEDAGKDVFVLVHANADSYESTTTKYEKKTVLEAKETGAETKISAYVDKDGQVVFAGLPAGEYTLSETVTPAGYNTIDDIKFTIECDLPDDVTTGEEKCTWSVGTDEDSAKSGVKYVEADNAFEITVVNQKGNTLPETGGIGTTIFYALGGILVIAAGVLLITKKRMSAEG